jgi:hypothetical protein
MKTRHGFFFGFAVMFIAAIFSFSLLGCDTNGGDDPGGGGGTPANATIKLTPVKTNKFTLTLTGATWKDDAASWGLSKLQTATAL